MKLFSKCFRQSLASIVKWRLSLAICDTTAQNSVQQHLTTNSLAHFTQHAFSRAPLGCCTSCQSSTCLADPKPEQTLVQLIFSDGREFKIGVSNTLVPSLQELEFEPKTQSCKDEMSSLLTHETKQRQRLMSDHSAQDEPCCLHKKKYDWHLSCFPDKQLHNTVQILNSKSAQSQSLTE